DYYYRYTDKLLTTIWLPGNHNGYDSQWRNAGAISNEGVELMIKYDIFNRTDLYWKISVNGAKNWNRFEKSYDGKDFSNNIIGKPLNGIYAYKTDGFIDKQDEMKIFYNQQGVSNYLSGSSKQTFFKPGDHKFIDVNGDGTITAYDQVYCGSALPIVSGGIVNEFRWKNFDLNMLMVYSLGRHIVNNIPKTVLVNADYALMIDLNDASFWEKPGDHPDYPKLEIGRKWDYVDRDVEKVNYLKLKTLTMGYSFPQKWSRKAGINELRIFVSGENLFTWTNYSGLDPETVDITSGIDNMLNYPLARKYTLGLTLKF
ncbi:MAG: SusC/RagA family TonB-linked outer membrane protein, partial [Butyricimonas faecihominis]